MRNEKGQFVAGPSREQYFPVGTITIRTRHKRDNERRAWIKIAEPNTWILLARHRWTEAYGPIPPDFGIHHKDNDKLNDNLSNLELVSKSEHLALHYEEYKPRLIANIASHRRERRWSTKSKTKRTGHPPSWDMKQMEKAIGAYFSSNLPASAIAEQFSVPANALRKKIRAIRNLL